jgi:translation initiation factor 2B subunit (eIF-2B alpha/beta/delta family)
MTGFADDRSSGSSDVALSFLAELKRWAGVDRSTSSVALRARLLAWLRAAQEAQPSMALIHQLAARALAVADTGVGRGDGIAELRAHLDASAVAEAEDLQAARTAVARQAIGLLAGRRGWIATLSASGTVRTALLEARRAGREPHALVAESRPGLEGRGLAEALAHAGIPVWLVVDAALPLLATQAEAVWIGADAVTDHGVLNKVGSYGLALAAREHGVPVHALAERRKFLPAATPALRIAEMPPEPVWERPPAGVRPRNVVFELVPLNLLRGVVVEDGVLGPAEAATLARERPLPEELRG